MADLEIQVGTLMADNGQLQKELDAALKSSNARDFEIQQLRRKLDMVSDNKDVIERQHRDDLHEKDMSIQNKCDIINAHQKQELKDLKQIEGLSNDLVTLDRQIRELLELRAKDTKKIATLESAVAELENFLTKANEGILLESQNSRKKDGDIAYLQQQLCMVRAAIPSEDLQTQNAKLTISLQESRESTAREKIHLAEATKRIGLLESQIAGFKKNHAEKTISEERATIKFLVKSANTQADTIRENSVTISELRSKLYKACTTNSPEEIENLKAANRVMTANFLKSIHDKECLIEDLQEMIRDLNQQLNDNEEHMDQMEKAQETIRIQHDNNLLCIMGDLDALNAAVTRKIERIQKNVDSMTSQVDDSN